MSTDPYRNDSFIDVERFIGDRRIHNRWDEEVGVCHEMVEHLRRGSGATSPLGRGDALRRSKALGKARSVSSRSSWCLPE